MPSSSLAEVEIGVEVGVEVGLEVGVEIEVEIEVVVEVILARFFTFAVGWVGVGVVWRNGD